MPGWVLSGKHSAREHSRDYVHPMAVEVLKEIGIEHQGRTKTVMSSTAAILTWLSRSCDLAAEKCPSWLGKGKRVHMGFPDPAKQQEMKETIKQVFRQGAG